MKFLKWICNRFPSFRTIFIVTYQLLCTFGAFRMVIFDINTYLKDEDVTEITYKLYNQDKESVYPEITICVDSPWRDDQLHAYGDGVNKTTYENYLRGRSITDHMIDIDFDKVTIVIQRISMSETFK